MIKINYAFITTVLTKRLKNESIQIQCIDDSIELDGNVESILLNDKNNVNKNDYIVKYLKIIEKFIFDSQDNFSENKKFLLDKQCELFEELVSLGLIEYDIEETVYKKEAIDCIIKYNFYQSPSVEDRGWNNQRTKEIQF